MNASTFVASPLDSPVAAPLALLEYPVDGDDAAAHLEEDDDVPGPAADLVSPSAIVE